MNFIVRILYLLFAEQVWQNNVLIEQFVTPWVSELAQLSIYTDIMRCLGSGTIFSQHSISSSIPLVNHQVGKTTLILALL